MLSNKSEFHSQLLSWYQQHKRDLPWRKTDNPYYIWVSEIMLQQTQVKTAIPYYRKFIKRFPTVSHLAEADLNDVLKIWEGLGYYARARNLHAAAKQLLNKYQGSVPQSQKELRQLPGIGDYTAAAILSIAFDIAIAAVDGNIKRVFSRLFMVDTPVNSNNANKVYQDLATTHLSHQHPGQFNQALMELGATVCLPRQPICSDCPVVNHCSAHRAGLVNNYPRIEPRAKIPTYQIAVGVVLKGERFLITRRAEKGLLGGLWEFPGGKLEKGESAESACVREIKEETGLLVETVEFLTRVKHAYTHFKIELEVYICRYLSGRVKLNGPTDYRWITVAELTAFPFPKANHRFIPMLLDLMAK